MFHILDCFHQEHCQYIENSIYHADEEGDMWQTTVSFIYLLILLNYY